MNPPHYLGIKKSARYFLSGPAEGNYKSVCMALHGYGQLAQYFVRPFSDPSLSDVLFVAPEGLHRFYLNGTSGRVGASWMTKEDRLKDMEDYCRYLDDLYAHLQPLISRVGHCGILGFSQGVATACRWLTHSRFSFDYLINYAGAFPPDLDHPKAIQKMQNLPVHLLLGKEDEYISEVQYRAHLQQLGETGFSVEGSLFEGGHKIYAQVVRSVFDKVMGL